MLIKLFDIQNGKVVPTEHCYTLKSLKAIIEKYPDSYLSVFQYVFYMTCPDPDMNPFFNLPEHEKEDMIIEEVNLEESPEDGRDGNLTSLVNTAAKFDQIRQSFKGAYSDMKDEQQSSVRGGQGLAYDQL